MPTRWRGLPLALTTKIIENKQKNIRKRDMISFPWPTRPANESASMVNPSRPFLSICRPVSSIKSTRYLTRLNALIGKRSTTQRWKPRLPIRERMGRNNKIGPRASSAGLRRTPLVKKVYAALRKAPTRGVSQTRCKCRDGFRRGIGRSGRGPPARVLRSRYARANRERRVSLVFHL